MDYIQPASCTDTEFRKMWMEFEWENKVWGGAGFHCVVTIHLLPALFLLLVHVPGNSYYKYFILLARISYCHYFWSYFKRLISTLTYWNLTSSSTTFLRAPTWIAWHPNRSRTLDYVFFFLFIIIVCVSLTGFDGWLWFLGC